MRFTELLDEISLFSVRLADLLKTNHTHSLWAGDKFAPNEPHQIIVHYTASPFFYGNVRWFLQENLNSRVSAHYLVGDEWGPVSTPLAKDLPLVRSLPVPIAEIVEPDRVAWHATTANRHAVGIEIVNAGSVKSLRRADGDVTNCRSGGTFSPYAVKQVEATKKLIGELHRIFITCIDPADILGHEHVQQNKIDPGPLFPLEQMRAQFCLEGEKLVNRFDARDWFYAHDGAGWLTFLKHTDLHLDVELPKALFAAMGYHVIRKADGTFDAPKKTITTFQQMMNLKQDGVIGPQTKAAMTQRWADVDFAGKPKG